MGLGLGVGMAKAVVFHFPIHPLILLFSFGTECKQKARKGCSSFFSNYVVTNARPIPTTAMLEYYH